MLLVTGGMAPVAQGQALQVVTPEDQDAYVQQFHHEGDTPPVVDGVGGYTEQEIAEIHEAIRQAQESGAPKDELIPGEMWSDKVELPATIDKAAADEAEIAIAQQQSQPQTRALAAAAACQTFWPSPHQVCGAILERYIQQGAQFGWMLLPSEGQALNPDGQGYRQRFMTGFIYWHPTTGAHAVNNYSAQVWVRNGWEAGWMGYPTGGEVPVAGSNPIDGELNGWVQTFQGGRVYRSPVLDGFQVASINGLILDKWLELGGPNSELGFPIADEAITSDGVGRVSIFQHGVIYWHPSYGAWEITGFIEQVWKMRGGLESSWGYPTSAPVLDPDAPVETIQNFSGGVLKLADEFQGAGLSMIEDKEVSNLLLEYFDYLGVGFPGSSSLAAPEEGLSQIMAEASMSICPKKDSTQPSFGGVTIPSHYDYWGCLKSSRSPDPSSYGRHDYCTYSSDSFRNPSGPNAEFSGACSRHDLCMDAADAVRAGYGPCNSVFYDQLAFICAKNYTATSRTRAICVMTAKGYWAAVTGTHVGQN